MGGLRSDTGLSGLSVISEFRKFSVGLAEQSGWGVSGRWGHEDSEHRYLSRSLVAECSNEGVAGGEHRDQVHFSLFCFYDIWMWMREIQWKKLNMWRWEAICPMRSLRRVEGKGFGAQEGVTSSMSQERQRALVQMEEGTWFGRIKLKCSLLLISHLM